MKLFSCKVRLRGDARDEVRKSEVTSAEIGVLKDLHGDDAVIEVVEAGNSDRSVEKERERLQEVYGERTILRIFGAPKLAIGDELPLGDAPPERKARRTRETVEAANLAAASHSSPAPSPDALD